MVRNRNRIFIGMSRIYRTLATISGRPLLSQSGYADSRRMSPRQLPLTSLTRSAWPFRPGSPPLVHLPARASPPAHSNTLSFHTWLVVAAFLRRRQPSSPRITARRSRATHSPSPSRPPTLLPTWSVRCPLVGQHMLSPRAEARFGRRRIGILH